MISDPGTKSEDRCCPFLIVSLNSPVAEQQRETLKATEHTDTIGAVLRLECAFNSVQTPDMRSHFQAHVMRSVPL